MKKNILLIFILFAGFILFFSNCNKPASNLHIPPALAHFIGDRSQVYFITANPAPVHKIKIGVTEVSSQDRTISYKVSSTTGAVQGTHYSLTSGSTVLLPGGQSIAEIEIQGVYAPYTSGRKDTLLFTLTEPSISPAEYDDTVKLILRGPCFDGAIGDEELEALKGVYTNCNDAGFVTSGPYPMTIVSVTRLTPTTARAVINNVWDYGLGDVNFILDWTDPNNTTIRVEAPTVTPANPGIFNAAYNGMNLVIRDHTVPGTASNKFSVCNGRLNLRYQFGVYNPTTGAVLGYFGTVATTVMMR